MRRDSTDEDDSLDGVPQRLERVDEVTRPVDIPVMREHGLSGSLLAGTDLRIEGCIDRGACGEVYKATRASDGCSLAVKVLRHRSDGGGRGRFHREVEILREIDSPWVVKVVSVGVLPDERPWYAMEYFDGRSLARIISATPVLDVARVVSWLRGACRGLAAIHEAGWVHRDVKPANVLIVEIDGMEEVRIVDLGIAERIGVRSEQVSGTPEYFAPEQAELRPGDPRSDIYSLGCCAYELLTGQRVVSGLNAMAKINQHLDGVHTRWSLAPNVPLELRHLVQRCLARQPDDRPPTMHALRLELQHVQQQLARCGGLSLPLPSPWPGLDAVPHAEGRETDTIWERRA